MSLTAQPTDESHATTFYYVDSFSGDGKSRYDFSLAINDQDHDYQKTMLTSLDSNTVIEIHHWLEKLLIKNSSLKRCVKILFSDLEQHKKDF